MRALLQKGARASRLFLTDPNENLINVIKRKMEEADFGGFGGSSARKSEASFFTVTAAAMGPQGKRWPSWKPRRDNSSQDVTDENRQKKLHHGVKCIRKVRAANDPSL